MSFETLNQLISIPVFVSWILMMALPRWKGTHRFLYSDIVPVGIGAIYFSIAAQYLPGWLSSFQNLESIAKFMAKPDLLFIGWIHYLAFDLFVGRSILADSQRRGVPHILMVPCLFVTLMFGPAGYLAYRIALLFTGKGWKPINPFPEV